MKLLKKITTIIILLSMLITLNSPIISYATDGNEYEIKEEETWDISKNGDGSVVAKWTMSDKTITISGSGEMKDWLFDSKEDWHNSIYTTIVEKFEIESGVKQLGSRVFSGCCNMEVVNLPESLTDIGWGAFEECKSLKSLRIPSNVRLINTSLRPCISLTEITVPDNHIYYKNLVFLLLGYKYYNCQSVVVPQ